MWGVIVEEMSVLSVGQHIFILDLLDILSEILMDVMRMPDGACIIRASEFVSVVKMRRLHSRSADLSICKVCSVTIIE